MRPSQPAQPPWLNWRADLLPSVFDFDLGKRLQLAGTLKRLKLFNFELNFKLLGFDFSLHGLDFHLLTNSCEGEEKENVDEGNHDDLRKSCLFFNSFQQLIFVDFNLDTGSDFNLLNLSPLQFVYHHRFRRFYSTIYSEKEHEFESREHGF